MHRRSPSGQQEPVLTRDTRVPNIAVTDGSVDTLERKVFQWFIITGTVAVAPTINLPPDPQDGDEVWVKDRHIGAAGVNIAGNGHNIDGGATDVLATAANDSRLYKFVTSQNEWLTFVEG